jgi:hypothetical protein
MDESQWEGVIDKIAEKLGVAVDKIQPLAEEYVRQVQMVGWVYIFAAAFCFILSVTIFIVALRTYAKGREERWKDEAVCAVAIIASIVWPILLGVSAGVFFPGLARVLAPYTYII